MDNHYGGHPALDVCFVNQLLSTFGNDRILLAVHKTQDTVTCMALVEPCGVGRWRVFSPANAPLVLMVVGENASANTDCYADLLRILPGFSWLLGSEHQDARFPVLPTDAVDRRSESLPHKPSIRIDIQGSFSDYWRSRSQRFRQNVERRRRGIAAAMTGLSFCWVREPHRICAAVDSHAFLESSSWKGQTGTAISEQNGQLSFYKAVLSEFALTGGALVGQLHGNDGVIASQLAIKRRGIVVLLKTAYDPNLAQYGPGRLLQFHVLQHLFEEQNVKSIEFCTQASREDLKWVDECVEVHAVNFYRGIWLRNIFRALRRSASHGIE
ncbi:MAG: GNAT family N-acetyltransferase [Rhodoferax sp.]|uniref:GNAT family N-acetyltransferase n=1 Tax=Rhodoferax sp. TaxID=50421 RepID=UPI00271E4836|nr:GNAT family N-acetyltransferase [Rhodoferax sp.]MDO8450884.1 GNAT family N-acetyltransferase [Rhodoferax sp.]